MSSHHTSLGRHSGITARHLNQHDLAARWRMSVRTLERWRSQRQGPRYLKIGARVAYRVEDIEAFEAAQLRDGAAADVKVPAAA
jgi:predicted DNA-binding transcriptional regulator AlpA